MPILEPIDMSFSDKKFSMIIYGPPGLGKTTLALSAPDPVLIDTDRGISRVKAQHRKATSMCNTYEEILEDIKTPQIQQCQTIIIDTGGSFVTYLQDWAMRNNPAARQKSGALSQKGFGIVKQEFLHFTNNIRDVMNKNIIYIFHSDEQKDENGKFVQRLQCEGSARNLVWQPCDFGGFMQMNGNTRTITFTPSEQFFAKGCYGIEGTKNIPTLTPNDANNFITKLFNKAKECIEAENNMFISIKEKYKKAMETAVEIIDNVKTLDDVNAAINSILSLEHELTSKRETGELLKEKAVSLGFAFDKETKKYIVKAEKKGEAQ